MRTILLYSGGLDSTVLLKHLLKRGDEVKCLSVDYGQRHARELWAAATICKRLAVEHHVADLKSLKPILAGSSQTDSSVPVPHGHYAEESMKLTVVPNRNMILLSCAVAWAVSLKFESVAYAAHAEDRAIYPDCREEFVAALQEAVLLADLHLVRLNRPFVTKTKAQIVELGKSIDAPMEQSWSCFECATIHCGLCGACTQRIEAFRDSGVQDATKYAA